MIVYKVLFAPAWGGLRSAASKMHMLGYHTYEETVPHIGKIFAFLTYSHALNWARQQGMNRLQVWECEARGVSQPTMYIPCNATDVERFWEDPEYLPDRFPEGMVKTPPGTVWCDGLTPLREVEEL